MSVFNWLKKHEEPGKKDEPNVEENEKLSEDEIKALGQRVIETLRTIFDPEIPVNIYDLGLIYDLDVDATGAVNINMTLTSPGCPVAQTFPETVECAVNAVPGVTEATVDLVWDPPWSREMMSEAAQLELGLL